MMKGNVQLSQELSPQRYQGDISQEVLIFARKGTVHQIINLQYNPLQILRWMNPL